MTTKKAPDILLSLLTALNDSLYGKFKATLSVSDVITLTVEWRFNADTGEREQITYQHAFKDEKDYLDNLMVVGTDVIRHFSKVDACV